VEGQREGKEGQQGWREGVRVMVGSVPWGGSTLVASLGLRPQPRPTAHPRAARRFLTTGVLPLPAHEQEAVRRSSVDQAREA